MFRVDTPVANVRYCACNTKHVLKKEDGWEPYVERKDILVWRKEHRQKKGLYHYKLYGRFDDVSVWEFLAVQLDLSKYRLGWDTSTAQCREVESQKHLEDDEGREHVDHDDDDTVIPSGDTTSNDQTDSNGRTDQLAQNKSQALVYYWEVQYPAFFSNRWRVTFNDVLFPSLFSF